MALGNQDKALSPFLKAWVKQGGVAVCGAIGEGTSKELTSSWNVPFADASLGAKFQKTAGLLQAGFGMTTVSTLNTMQVWENTQYQFSLVLRFYALSDPQTEVEQAIIALERMMAPELNKIAPGGRTPDAVTINIGRNAMYTDCVIKSLSAPLDKERDRRGNLIRADVTLSIEPISAINKSAIK